jgi:hypothetical protein
MTGDDVKQNKTTGYQIITKLATELCPMAVS